MGRSEAMDDERREFLEAAMPHLDVLYRIARHAVREHHRAEDLVQETYLRAFAAYSSHRGPSTRAWLVAILLNLVRSDARRRSRRVVEQPLDVEPGRDEDRRERPVAEQAIGTIESERVTAALARLPEEQRMAVVLMDLAGYSAAEVASQLGCPRNTILSRVHRAHRRLAELLQEEEVDHELR